MERTEATRKTLAVGRSTLAAKPQAPGDKTLKQLPEPSALSGSPGSGSGREVSVARTQENGGRGRVRVRGSDNTNGGVVETEIAKMTGGSGSSSSSSLKIKENEREGVVGGSENVIKGLNSVLGVNKKEEHGCEKIAAAGGAKSGLIGARSSKKAVSKIEVKEGRDLNKKYGFEENGTPLSENEEDPDDSMLEMSEKKDGEEDDLGDEEYEYAVGDFVWGKIKSHPWWPGRIYDSSDASEYAAKYSHRDHLLVAYFGDGTFAWCYPSQLQPFEDNFEEMSKQTNSKNFVKAVEGAVDEFSRVIELEMTCSCVLKENKVGFARPVAMNAGIKEGVVVPEGGIGQHSIALFEPAKFLANLRYIARAVSVNSMLELNVLKSQLLAFYRATGGYELPRYTEPEYILGLEDKIRSNGECNGEVDVPIQGPFEEDWLSQPSPGFKQTGQTSSQKWPLISEDKLYQRRKQKSIAEIMGGEMDVKPKNNEENMAKEGTHSGKLASISSRRKKKGSDEAETHASNNLTSPSGRKKKIKLSGTPITTENKVPSVENASGRGNEETRKGRVSRDRKAKRSSHVKDDGDGIREGIENGSVSRERKKSKYLSPPYTSLKWLERNSSFKKDSKLEFLEVASVARVGERMSRAAGQLVGSPPIVKCSGETYQKNVSRELSTGHETSGGLIPDTPKQDENKMIDPMATKASANKVLSQIRSAALNPPYAREGKSLDMIRVFFSAFRNSVYHDGSNYKTYNKGRPSRKRKSLESEPVSLEKDSNRTDDNSVERKSLRTRNKKNEAKSDMNKLKQAAEASDTKTNDKETEGKPPSAALFLSYGPGVSMPSKDDLIARYSKFGSLNEGETEVLYDSFCARVVFVKSSDAEQAFKDSMRMSSSGDTKVSYRLRYLSGTSRIRKTDENRRPKASSSQAKEGGKNSSSRVKEGGKTPVENSSIHFIRQKLETMTSMLEKSDGSMTQEMKINLESEMKGLLKKVRTMAGSSSP